MNTLTGRQWWIAAALVTAGGFAATAAAGDLSEQMVYGNTEGTQSIHIQYARGELSTPDGRAALYGKIKRAARQICGPTGMREAGGVYFASRNRQCYEEAVSAALDQVDLQQLAGLGE